MANNKSEQLPVNPEVEAEASVNQKGLSKEAWAAMSAIAVALIGGTVAIITTLIPKLPIGQSSSPAISSAPISLPSGGGSLAVNSPVITADAITGRWTGQAKNSSGEFYTINVEIHPSCKSDEKCGTISVLQVPCYGEISLKAVQKDDYEFDVSNFDSRSSLKCTPGAGEHLKLLSDGRLSYRADWGVQGILDKAK
jgi:hypothetical protein